MKFENDFPNRQTIDRKSGAYLVFNGIETAYRGLHKFCFYLDGEKMDFLALIKSTYDKNNKETEIDWKFFQVQIPPHLEGREEEINQMIKQALEAHGLCYDREQYERVEANFHHPK